MTVDADYAQRLTSEALYAQAAPTGAPAWAERAVEIEVVSSLAIAADAATEALREANFFAGPLTQDRHVVMGRRRDLMLKCANLIGDRYGYAVAKLCFVMGYQENTNGTTTLIVLRPL